MKKLLSFIILCFFSLITFGQGNALLWEISKKGHQTSYLFGSIHSDDEQVLALGEKVLPFMYACDAYAGEIILQPEDMFALLPYLFEKDSTKRCNYLLTEEEMALVKKQVGEQIGEELTGLVPFMSPYMVASLMANPNESSGDMSAYFLDIFLQEKADSLEKELYSLESVKSQMAYIQKIDGKLQKIHLLELIEDLDKVDEEMAAMIQVYLNQDLEEMKAMIGTATKEDPLFTEGFMEERNTIQANGIMQIMKDQSVFVAIGAAHLPGSHGVIQLLLNAGFKLKAVPFLSND